MSREWNLHNEKSMSHPLTQKVEAFNRNKYVIWLSKSPSLIRYVLHYYRVR